VITGGQGESREILACLIVDDPPLRPHYGFLNYARLLREMQRHGFFTEIAFIPWYYRRSNPDTVRLLSANGEFFALCIHGCNHLDNEFGGTTYDELSALSITALWRMEQHARITGLPYDPVMVFPQGRFSAEAMNALRDSGYLAAFNSTLQATDRGSVPAVESRHAATMMYGDFPLFLRRYPTDRSGVLEDVACGRPVLVYGHHDVFRDGYKPMTDFVDWVNGLGNVKWTSLSTIVEHYLGTKAPCFAPSVAPSRLPLRLTARAAARRLMCEVRDEYVNRSDLLSRVYRAVSG
jgi:hypothetical protein